jgi:hypothetical protein
VADHGQVPGGTRALTPVRAVSTLTRASHPSSGGYAHWCFAKLGVSVERFGRFQAQDVKLKSSGRAETLVLGRLAVNVLGHPRIVPYISSSHVAHNLSIFRYAHIRR